VPSQDRQPAPYDRIKAAVLSGELLPGQQLVETTLAEWCGVSRTPIREALRRLEQDGVISRTDRGLVVRERSPEEILDIYETRIVLEALAARTAAARRSPFDVIRLQRMADRLEQLDTAAAGEAAMAELNREFHRLLWRATRSEPLIDLLTRIDLHLSRYPATTLSAPGRWDEANREHRAIIEAIEQQDPAAAAKHAADHFTRSRDLRLALWADEQI
jgi:DNA-binding GntR family transcriptional regulator